jgi:DNA-binding MarR family transcriptional regulator
MNGEQAQLIEEVAALLQEMGQRLEQHATVQAAEFDLTLAQAKVLVEIEPDEEVPMGVLAGRINYDASNLTGLVDRLEGRGILERRADPNDRRVKSLVLTEEGERVRQAFRRRLLDYSGSFGALSENQLQVLRNLLRVALGKE